MCHKYVHGKPLFFSIILVYIVSLYTVYDKIVPILLDDLKEFSADLTHDLGGESSISD